MKKLVLAICLLASPCVAQTPDPVMMQRLIASLQAQRNQAMDNAASWEAREHHWEELATSKTEELAKANAKLKELEAK